MKLSTKGRYAVTALADIALRGDNALVSLGEIAERQDISLAYLEQLVRETAQIRHRRKRTRAGRRVSGLAYGAA